MRNPIDEFKKKPTLQVHNPLAPLERLSPLPELSGKTGTNRTFSSTLDAQDDRQAIEAWLAALSGSPHTKRTYRKEAERFLLWCIFERNKPLSSATIEDCAAYRDFLADIGTGRKPWPWRVPENDWIGVAQAPRWSHKWRPFSGRLTPASQRQAIVILKVLHEWLTRQNYLRANPWAAVSSLAPPPIIKKERALTRTQIQWVLHTIDTIENPLVRTRAHATFMLAYHTGARLSEIASLRVSTPLSTPGRIPGGLRPAQDGNGYEIEIIGKGRKLRTVPVSKTLMSSLRTYFTERGMGDDPTTWTPNTPLIASLRNSALTPKAVYEILKKVFRMAATRTNNHADQIHLYYASPHWLRHSHATHALEAGAAIQDVQEVLGHASPATTSIYSHSSLKRKRTVVESL